MQVRAEQLRFRDPAHDAQFIRRVKVHPDFDLMSRQIGDPAVESQRRAVIHARRAVRRQPAAAQPFIKAAQPTEAISFGESHELRMNRALHRRLPSEEVAAILSPPNSHAARRQGGIGKRPIMHFDEIDAIARPAAQGSLADRPIVRGLQPQAIIADREAVEPDIVGDVGESPGFKSGQRPCSKIVSPKR